MYVMMELYALFLAANPDSRRIPFRISFFIRSINVCCILSVVSWCMFDRHNIGVMHISPFHASWCVHAYQWHIHFGFLCALHIFFLRFSCLDSFDTADNACIVTVFKYLRHFDLISALFYFHFFCCFRRHLLPFHWLCVFMCLLFCNAFSNANCIQHVKRTTKKRRSSIPKEIGIIQAGISSLS